MSLEWYTKDKTKDFPVNRSSESLKDEWNEWKEKPMICRCFRCLRGKVDV